MNSKDRKPFLLIGTFCNEKIKNEIQLAGYDIVGRNLTSSPTNWDDLITQLEKEGTNFSCVVLSLPESVLLIAQCPNYRVRFNKILKLLKGLPHLIFVYEDNLFGRFNIFDTNYYQKYLFYDTFFEQRTEFEDLKYNYAEKATELELQIVKDYVFETILPAAFLAEEKEWKKVWEYGPRFQLEYLNNGYGLIKDEKHSLYGIGNYLVELRNIMYISQGERADFLKLDNSGRLDFIKKKYEGMPKCDSLGEQKSFVNEIVTYIFSDDFVSGLVGREDYRSAKFRSFKAYLKRKRYNEDEEISSAIKRMNSLVLQMQEENLNIYAYKYTNDEVIILRDYIESEESGVVFRSYILKDRIYADEVEKLLSLLQEYISRVKKVDISFEQQKTDIGIVYVIRSKEKEKVKNDFLSYIKEFSDYFDQSCDHDLEELRSTLHEMHVDESDIEYFLTRFIKESRRIRLDLRQDYESKMLKLKHVIEADALNKEQGVQVIEEASTAAAPSVSSALTPSFSIVAGKGSYTQVIFGNPNYNEKDEELLRYIECLTEEKAAYEKELQILKDGSAGKSEKAGALSKLKKFLADNASEIGKIAFRALNMYIESLK